MYLQNLLRSLIFNFGYAIWPIQEQTMPLLYNHIININIKYFKFI